MARNYQEQQGTTNSTNQDQQPKKRVKQTHQTVTLPGEQLDPKKIGLFTGIHSKLVMCFVTILENKNNRVAIIELSKQKAVTPTFYTQIMLSFVCIQRKIFLDL